MEKRSYLLIIRHEEYRRLANLFFTDKSALENVKQCVVDAIYTTNIFGYTLINAIGANNVGLFMVGNYLT
jgi:hypothetical protein